MYVRTSLGQNWIILTQIRTSSSLTPGPKANQTFRSIQYSHIDTTKLTVAKCVPKIIPGPSSTADRADTKSWIKADFCRACQLRVPRHNIESHISGKNHQASVQRAQLLETDACVKDGASTPPPGTKLFSGHVWCRFCGIQVDVWANGWARHSGGAKHKGLAHKHIMAYIKGSQTHPRCSTKQRRVLQVDGPSPGNDS